MTTDAEHADVLHAAVLRGYLDPGENMSRYPTWDSLQAAIERSIEMLENGTVTLLVDLPNAPDPQEIVRMIRPNPGEREWIPHPPRWVRKARKRGYDVVKRGQTCP